MIYKPPNVPLPQNRQPGVFLAGTIDMGASEDWQSKVSNVIKNMLGDYVDVYNPRRDDWDSGIEQKLTDPRFAQQVKWELDALDYCTKILLHFEATSMSPITLLELGLYAPTGKLVVSCPKEFWRRGNVEVVCDRYGIPLYENPQDAAQHIAEMWGNE